MKPGLWDTLAAASDLALVGIVVTAASLPVVTAGGAFAVGSYAVRHWCRHRRLPPSRELLVRLRSALLPGAGALGLTLLAAGCLVVDVGLLRRGVVPGGGLAVAATIVVGGWLAAVALFTLLLVGRRPTLPWRTALRRAAGLGVAAPQVVLGPALVVAVAALLAAMVPITTPLLVGYGLFGAHIVADRLLPADADADADGSVGGMSVWR